MKIKTHSKVIRIETDYNKILFLNIINKTFDNWSFEINGVINEQDLKYLYDNFYKIKKKLKGGLK